MPSDETTIRVELEFVGAIRRPWPEQKRSLEVPAGSTIGGLLADLGYAEHEVRYLVMHVNGTKTKRAATLNDGDHLTVMLIIGGG